MTPDAAVIRAARAVYIGEPGAMLALTSAVATYLDVEQRLERLLSPDGRWLIGGRTRIRLPAKEAALLRLLALRAPGCVTRAEIECEVWGELPPADFRCTLQTHLHRLRCSLAIGLVPVQIVTVRLPKRDAEWRLEWLDVDGGKMAGRP